MQARRRAGSEVSPGSLAQDELLKCQLSDRLPGTLTLLLRLLQALHLVGLQPAEPLAPPILGELRNADRTHGFGDRPVLGYQHINLTELGDDLLRLVLLLGIPSSSKWLESHTSRRTTSQGADLLDRPAPAFQHKKS